MKYPITPVVSIVQKLGVYGLVLIVAALGIGASPNFLTLSTLLSVLDSSMLLGIVAVGVAFVTYSGNYADLSVPTTMAFSGVVAVEVLQFGIGVALMAGLLTGLVIGVVNGVVVGKWRANPIIWTLAMSFVVKGLMRWIWQNKQIYPDVKGGETAAGRIFTELYRFEVLPKVAIPAVVLVFLVIIGQYVLKRTQFGQQLKLVGSNPKAAAMTGINVPLVVGMTFVISASAAAVAGIFITSLSKVGAYYNGDGFDFAAVTAIVVGGLTLAGGRGDIVGVLGGVFVIGLMRNVMTLYGMGTFSQQIVTGIVFISVVGLNAVSLRKLGQDDA